ncbi:MAG TPA: carboxypeptidase-like regulatory domain-containing protein [Flavobacteriales bacterium]|nr:carboxypeptidase-like regulatory domain-containing protein [Flavobacteriales bacterium]
MRKLRALVVATTWFLFGCSFGQVTGSLMGRITDPVGAAVGDVAVQAVLPDTVFTTVSAADGSFHFATLPVGLCRLRTSHVAFRAAELQEVWVRAGKSERIELHLEPAINELNAVEVRAAVPERLDAITSEPLTVERSLRFPATFFDPARLAMSYAGVASTNDQANHFSVRGNGPGTNAWLLEGVEIVTPNHLTNAGTANDFPTLTGGGTTILSAQMLGSSRLLTGGMAAPYGNALGGIMDLRLRKGITDRRAYTIQAGLIGIDLSAEGPFKSGGKASYLINYRYSTLGLLGAMGVALGDEAITFQDLAFTVNLPLSDRSELLLFGMGGNSSNRFRAKDSAEWEFDKDDKDIDYEAKVAVAGLSFHQRIGQRARWSTTVALSQNVQDRNLYIAPYRRLPAFTSSIGLGEKKLSAHTVLTLAVGSRGRIDLGAHAMERTVTKDLQLWSERNASVLLRPYVRYRQDLSERFTVDVGVGYSLWSASDSGVVEPRFSIAWNMGQRDKLVLAAGIRGQMPMVQNYVLHYQAPGLQGEVFTDNTGLTLMRAQDVELRYSHRFGNQTIHLALFGQWRTHVPVLRPTIFYSEWPGPSMADVWNEINTLQLSSRGEGQSLGGHITLERDLVRGFFYQINATAFQATNTDGYGTDYHSRWNTRYAGNVVLGKELVKRSAERVRTWGVSLRMNITGGQARSIIPVEVPTADIYYDDTYRVDLRLYLKRERNGRSSLWSLDLLNATNAQNVAYTYYDQRKGEAVTMYQLGLIPNLSYRIEF